MGAPCTKFNSQRMQTSAGNWFWVLPQIWRQFKKVLFKHLGHDPQRHSVVRSCTFVIQDKRGAPLSAVLLKHRRVCVAMKSVLGSQGQTGNATETWGGPIAPVAPTVHALRRLATNSTDHAGGSGLRRAKREGEENPRGAGVGSRAPQALCLGRGAKRALLP